MKIGSLGKLLQNYKYLESKIFRILLKKVSDNLSVLFQILWLLTCKLSWQNISKSHGIVDQINGIA